jgi:hypothetical protein
MADLTTDSTDTAPQAPQDTPDAGNVSAVSDSGAVEGAGVNLQKSYSHLNSAVANLFDESGIRRNATISHVSGQSMADHIQDVGKILPGLGGITANVLTSTHTKHDPNGGATISHPAHKLRETLIPKDSEPAKDAVSSAKSFVNQAASLLGEDDPAVKLAKAQLQLVSTRDMAGMSLFDAGAALLGVPGPLIQKIARLHSMTHPDGPSPQLRASQAGSAPQDAQEGASGAQGQAQPAAGDQEAQPAQEAQESAPVAQQA